MTAESILKAPKPTDKEWHILRLLFEGLTNKQIGETLHLSTLTTRNYVSRMLLRFEAQNRTELLVKVIKQRGSLRRIGTLEKQPAPCLTNAERSILQLLSKGLSNCEIGERLYLSERTIRNYMRKLTLKFAACNRTQLLAKVILVRRHDHRPLIP